MGGYAVGAPENLIEPMRKYAHLLGLCFQIKDDIFDYFSDEKIGKPTGNDLREGKITLPLLNALSRTDLPQTADMLALVEKDELTASEIATLIQFAKDAGGIDYAFATMKRIGDEARRQLDIFPDSPARKALDDIIAYIINRNI